MFLSDRGKRQVAGLAARPADLHEQERLSCYTRDVPESGVFSHVKDQIRMIMRALNCGTQVSLPAFA